MDEFFSQLQILITQYQQYFTIGMVALVVSFLATPFTGVLAHRMGAVDAPARLRERNDPNRSRKIHDTVMPLLGGVAIFVGFLVGVIIAAQSGFFSGHNQKLLHILLAVVLIIILGIWDAVRDVPAKPQFAFQILVALIIVSGGIKIEAIDMLGLDLSFNAINFTINLGSLTLYFSPIADLITIIWIVGLINAINWLDGIDGLATSISFFAAITMVFISVKFLGVNPLGVFGAAMGAALVGAILGYLPYNLPPAKTFGGSSGVFLEGLVLAVLAIISSRRLTASLVLLALPVVDAIWVLTGRYIKHRKEIKNPLDLLKISDKTHLHHRLLETGLSKKQTLGAEVGLFLLFCVAAYYIAGFSTETVLFLIAVALCLLLFVAIRFAQSKHKVREAKRIEAEEAAPKVRVQHETPEEKYAY